MSYSEAIRRSFIDSDDAVKKEIKKAVARLKDLKKEFKRGEGTLHAFELLGNSAELNKIDDAIDAINKMIKRGES